ncbi:hypothetical protein MPTK1_6g17020 [Marchantia polymorpha subsp. ruderalis]|uniref:Uncharacterized protein n=2 Tax=Marchantia polymorpha TaxID=3197 RepID=A0AAF6BSW5_MARPO|nr:hypothetical protein MARPO_0144s0015 [Marchantia polymorpha]BBN15099.1 hypothetical protein Mp_6g17020 [Marchantia polymorpha subsp. ruderalis]|eukprot:PTQ29296.1 hypothetical protein MARPO_0144s0015 [Marchantia polymorpha]
MSETIGMYQMQYAMCGLSTCKEPGRVGNLIRRRTKGGSETIMNTVGSEYHRTPIDGLASLEREMRKLHSQHEQYSRQPAVREGRWLAVTKPRSTAVRCGCSQQLTTATTERREDVTLRPRTHVFHLLPKKRTNLVRAE